MMAFKEEPKLSDLKYKTYSRNDKWNGLKAYDTVMLAGAIPIHQMYGETRLITYVTTWMVPSTARTGYKICELQAQ